jgi:hypothetical protein
MRNPFGTPTPIRRPFDVVGTDPRVRFVPWSETKFLARLRIDGTDAAELIAPCGTCGVTFRRLGTDVASMNDSDAATLLNALPTAADHESLVRLSAPLETGTYGVGMYEATPRLVEPGGPGDYFVEHHEPLHRPNAFDEQPGTGYFRFGEDVEDRSRSLKGARVLVGSLVMPLQRPEHADEGRIAHWESRIDAGERLTALAISFVDIQGPAVWDHIAEGYPFREHRMLVHVLLDGHHRAIACARRGVPLRILSFVHDWDVDRIDEWLPDAERCLALHLLPTP